MGFWKKIHIVALITLMLTLTACATEQEILETTDVAETTMPETTVTIETTESTEEATEPTSFPWEISQAHGIEVYSYAGTTFPVELGIPILSEEELDALIAKKDYAKTAEAITTLPDVVRLYERMNIRLERKLRDPGDGIFAHSRSAWQVLDSGLSTWAGMCSLTATFPAVNPSHASRCIPNAISRKNSA